MMGRQKPAAPAQTPQTQRQARSIVRTSNRSMSRAHPQATTRQHESRAADKFSGARRGGTFDRAMPRQASAIRRTRPDLARSMSEAAAHDAGAITGFDYALLGKAARLEHEPGRPLRRSFEPTIALYKSEGPDVFEDLLALSDDILAKSDHLLDSLKKGY